MSGNMNVGYGYVWPFKGSYLAGDILAGTGPQWQSLDFPNGENRYRVVMDVKGIFNFSYNLDFTTWMLGFKLRHEQVQADLGSMEISSYSTSLMATAVTRF